MRGDRLASARGMAMLQAKLGKSRSLRCHLAVSCKKRAAFAFYSTSKSRAQARLAKRKHGLAVNLLVSHHLMICTISLGQRVPVTQALRESWEVSSGKNSRLLVGQCHDSQGQSCRITQILSELLLRPPTAHMSRTIRRPPTFFRALRWSIRRVPFLLALYALRESNGSSR